MTREGLLSMPGWTKYCPGLRWFPTTDQTAAIRLLRRNGQSSPRRRGHLGSPARPSGAPSCRSSGRTLT